MIEMVEATPVTVDQWRHQRAINKAGDAGNPLALGFSAFFLNRTNRSGVIGGGGIIGGLNQTGNYLIDCRFNREDLVRRIKRVSCYADRIHLTNADALDFIDICETELPAKSLLFIDPPCPACAAADPIMLGGPTAFIALCTMNTLNVAPTARHLDFLLYAVETWLDATNGDRAMWHELGIGRKIAEWFELAAIDDPSLYRQTHPSRSHIDAILGRLVTLACHKPTSWNCGSKQSQTTGLRAGSNITSHFFAARQTSSSFWECCGATRLGYD